MTNFQIYLSVLKERPLEAITLDIMDLKNNNPELNRSIPYLALCEMARGLVGAEVAAWLLASGDEVFPPDRYKDAIGGSGTVKEMLPDY